MHDYKNNLFKPSIEPKDRLEQTILLDLLPEKDLNRPSYSVATISRIMSNYIRTLRHIVKREWSFEVLNLYESVFPLFVDFYECVVANELAVRKDNVEWGEIWNSRITELWGRLKFQVVNNVIHVDYMVEQTPYTEEGYYIESNFMVMVRRLSYYFQSPENIPPELLKELEGDINLGAIFNQWMTVSDNPQPLSNKNIEFDEEEYKVKLDFGVGTVEGALPPYTLKQCLKNSSFNYDNYRGPFKPTERPPHITNRKINE